MSKKLSRHFSIDDQIKFAVLSGDYNPIHIDSLQARRMPYGEPVVHGMHLIIWALCECMPRNTCMKSLDVKFTAPLKVGTEVYICLDVSGSIRLMTEVEVIALINFTASGESLCDCVVPDTVEMQKTSRECDENSYPFTAPFPTTEYCAAKKDSVHFLTLVRSVS